MSDPSSPRSDAKRSDLSNQWISAFLLRFTGYTLLILTVSNTVSTVIPPQLMDPKWEFDTIETLVGQAPIPLIGLTLVFYGGLRYRRQLEKLWLRPLAILAIVVGIVFLLMIPLGWANSMRLNQQDQQASDQQLAQQRAQFEQIESRLSSMPAPEIVQEAQRLQVQLPNPTDQDPESIKSTILDQLKTRRTEVEAQAQATRERQQLQHTKTTVKTLLGALISGACFIYMGYMMQKIYALRSK